MTIVDMGRLQQIAEVEFAAIVTEASVPDLNELRIILNEAEVVESYLSPDPEDALREFLTFAQQWLKKSSDDKT